MKTILAILLFMVGGVSLPGCVCAPDKGVDTEKIRRNADDADRDLDRESQKNQD